MLVLSAFLAGLVIFLVVFLYASGQFRGGGATSYSAIGGPFQLVDQDGKPLTDQDLKGEPVLVFFGYTHCPDVCPTTLFEMSEVLHALGKDAAIVGEFVEAKPPLVELLTRTGGRRIVQRPYGEELPRIC